MTVKITAAHLKILRVIRQGEDWNLFMSVPITDPNHVEDLFKANLLEIRSYPCSKCQGEHEGFFITDAGRKLEAEGYGTKNATKS